MENPEWKFAFIAKRLSDYWGEAIRPQTANALDSLIETILSQNTNDNNRNLAFRRLKQAFPDWEAVENAPTEVIEDVIRPAGLAPQKAPRIKKVLEWLRETHGSFDLDFICEWPEEKAIETLSKLRGVGIKTISVVLLFACKKDVFPVDTHIYRITKRVGLIPEKTSVANAHRLLGQWVPKGKAFSLHINLLKLGRTICKARRPKCEICPIRNVCDYYQSIVDNFEDLH